MQNQIDINKTYQELLAINVDLNFNDAPNPAYIQTKIIECHKASKKVEEFHTKLKMAMSRVMRSLSLEEAKFETLQRDALSQNEAVKRFPSYQDRVAYVGTLLEKNITDINEFKIKLEEHKNLEKALNLVIKNLTRLNSDIKAQQKLMDSQISKLGSANIDDKAVKDLMGQLGSISQQIDAEGVEVQEAEEETDSEQESEAESEPDLSDLLVEEKNPPKSETIVETKAEEKPNTEENLLDSLLEDIPDELPKSEQKRKSNTTETVQVDVDLETSFLDDDSLMENEESDSEIETNPKTESESEINTKSKKTDADDLEDMLETVAKEETSKKQTLKKEAVKEKPKTKGPEKNDATEGDINIDDLLAGIT